MTFLYLMITAAMVFGVCYGVDRLFQKLFRSKAEHMSGLAVRVNKRYGLFGVILMILGVLAFFGVEAQGKIMIFGGVFVLLLGASLTVYYLGSGVFYDGETFLVSALGKKDRRYQFGQIVSQRLYVITGGGVVIELEMDDGKTVSLQSGMDGVYPFMDTAFAAWSQQKGIAMQDCDFYDPAKSWWFPHEEV